MALNLKVLNKIIKINNINLITKRFNKNSRTVYTKILSKLAIKSSNVKIFDPKPKSKMKKKYPSLFDSSEMTIKNKLKVLNKTYLIQVSEILSNLKTDFDFSNVNLTKVETSSSLKSIKIFWNYIPSDTKFQIKEIYDMLEKNKLKIVENLKNTYSYNTVPLITFYYDCYEDKLNEINKIYSNLQIRENKKYFNPEKFFEESELFKNSKYKKNLFEKNLSTELKEEDQSYNFVRIENIKFQHPHDMKLNMFNLDYEDIINKILFKINYTSKSNLYDTNQNKNIPSIYVENKIFKNEITEQNTNNLNSNYRIDNMKEFLYKNRRQILKEGKLAKNKMYDKLITHTEELLNAKKKYDSYDLNKGIPNEIKKLDN